MTTTDTERFTASQLREQIATADTAMRGLSLRMDDLREQITALDQRREQIESAQGERTTTIHNLQTESGQLHLELEDLKIDVVLQGEAAVADSITWREERRAEIKLLLKEAASTDTKMTKAEAVQLSQLEADRLAFERQLAELDGQRSVFASKRQEIFAQLGETLYREAADRLAELSEAISHATHAVSQYTREHEQAKVQMNRDLQPWDDVRWRAVKTFDLDVKPPDSTTKIIKALQSLLDLIEEEGRNLPLQIGDTFVSGALIPIDVNQAKAILGPMAIGGLDRRNWFSQRRTALTELLRKYNERRW